MKIQNGFSLKPLDADAKTEQQNKQLRDAAKMYEGYFLDQMVRAMRSTVPKEEGILKKNFAEQIFQGQLDQKYVENWTERGGVGLADMIYNQISERMQGTGKAAIPRGALPLNPKPDIHGVPSADSIKMKSIPAEGNAAEYRFEVPNPSGQPFEITSPLTGKVAEAKVLEDGWSFVRLDHGLGNQSELTFPGSLGSFEPDQEVQAGQRLGQLDLSRPVLAWKLEWDKGERA